MSPSSCSSTTVSYVEGAKDASTKEPPASPTVYSTLRLPQSASEKESNITPSVAIRNQYYENLQHSRHDKRDKAMRSSSSAMILNLASLNTSKSRLDSQAKKGLRRLSRASTLFRPKNTAEPKITLDHQRKGSVDSTSTGSSSIASTNSLLQRLSKTTAPVRARLSAMSQNPIHGLRPASSISLSIPLRRSAENVHHAAAGVTRRSSTTHRRMHGERSMSFSFGNEETVLLQHELLQRGEGGAPIVYPALLSKVAEAFRERVTLGTKTKDSIEYQNAFDGREAVDKLAYIIKTSDRNLAVLVGRALDAQKFFHDVNYEHRLRDSVHELYQFQDRVIMNNNNNNNNNDVMLDSPVLAEDESDVVVPSNNNNNNGLPNGVFTVLTDCYSPTCSRDSLCYSPSCPRRLEQRARRSRRGLHGRTESRSSLLGEKEEDRLWINTVPQSVVDKLSKEERKRQENIYELIYTEKDFVEDLAYVNKFWIKPLLDEDILEPERRQEFVRQVFWNIMEIYKVNAGLAEALQQRQVANPVVDQVGDIMLAHVVRFEPFVKYGAHQVIGKYVFETEKANPSFARFVEATERLKQSRKLELNGYLTKPTTRLGRYNLLLREILRHTPKDHPDQEQIPKAMNIIAEFLGRVNKEAGKTESKHNLQLLEQRLISYLPADIKDLGLRDENRELVLKGTLKRKGTSSDSSDMLLFLLDHCLLITKLKYIHNTERYKLYRKPIPLELLSLSFPDNARRSSSILPYNRTSKDSFSSVNSLDITILPSVSTPATPTSCSSKSGYPLCFSHLGKHGATPITLYATTMAIRRQWVTKIQAQQELLMKKNRAFEMAPISDNFFVSAYNRVRCSATFDNGKSIAFGSDQGVYIQKKRGGGLVRILAIEKVSQIGILEGASRLMLVLADKTLYTYSLDTLLEQLQRNHHDNGSSSDCSRRHNASDGRKISNHVSFFKMGKIHDHNSSSSGSTRTLVCYVRQSPMTSTIRALETHEAVDPKRKNMNPLGRLMLRNAAETLKVYKDLYIPGAATSIQFFRNIICVGCPRGFQMVDLKSTQVQSVLHPGDPNHQAILQRENLKPISMFRHETDGNILLCYNELAFYIDKKGWRVRKNFMIHWESNPQTFAYKFPYVIAFDPALIEIRHMDTGRLVQVIPGHNIRCLQPDAQNVIHCVVEDRTTGNEVIFELKHIEQSS